MKQAEHYFSKACYAQDSNLQVQLLSQACFNITNIIPFQSKHNIIISQVDLIKYMIFCYPMNVAQIELVMGIMIDRLSNEKQFIQQFWKNLEIVSMIKDNSINEYPNKETQNLMNFIQIKFAQVVGDNVLMFKSYAIKLIQQIFPFMIKLDLHKNIELFNCILQFLVSTRDFKLMNQISLLIQNIKNQYENLFDFIELEYLQEQIITEKYQSLQKRLYQNTDKQLKITNETDEETFEYLIFNYYKELKYKLKYNKIEQLQVENFEKFLISTSSKQEKTPIIGADMIFEMLKDTSKMKIFLSLLFDPYKYLCNLQIIEFKSNLQNGIQDQKIHDPEWRVQFNNQLTLHNIFNYRSFKTMNVICDDSNIKRIFMANKLFAQEFMNQLDLCIKNQFQFKNINHIANSLISLLKYNSGLILHEFCLSNIIFEFLLYMDQPHVKFLLISILSLEKNKVLGKHQAEQMWTYVKQTNFLQIMASMMLEIKKPLDYEKKCQRSYLNQKNQKIFKSKILNGDNIQKENKEMMDILMDEITKHDIDRIKNDLDKQKMIRKNSNIVSSWSIFTINTAIQREKLRKLKFLNKIREDNQILKDKREQESKELHSSPKQQSQIIFKIFNQRAKTEEDQSDKQVNNHSSKLYDNKLKYFETDQEIELRNFDIDYALKLDHYSRQCMEIFTILIQNCILNEFFFCQDNYVNVPQMIDCLFDENCKCYSLIFKNYLLKISQSSEESSAFESGKFINLITKNINHKLLAPYKTQIIDINISHLQYLQKVVQIKYLLVFNIIQTYILQDDLLIKINFIIIQQKIAHTHANFENNDQLKKNLGLVRLCLSETLHLIIKSLIPKDIHIHIKRINLTTWDALFHQFIHNKNYLQIQYFNELLSLFLEHQNEYQIVNLILKLNMIQRLHNFFETIVKNGVKNETFKNNDLLKIIQSLVEKIADLKYNQLRKTLAHLKSWQLLVVYFKTYNKHEFNQQNQQELFYQNEDFQIKIDQKNDSDIRLLNINDKIDKHVVKRSSQSSLQESSSRKQSNRQKNILNYSQNDTSPNISVQKLQNTLSQQSQLNLNFVIKNSNYLQQNKQTQQHFFKLKDEKLNQFRINSPVQSRFAHLQIKVPHIYSPKSNSSSFYKSQDFPQLNQTQQF